MTDLFAANTPESFWRLCEPIPHGTWDKVLRKASFEFLAGPNASCFNCSDGSLAQRVLGEGQFGPHHWILGRAKQLYYSLRPFLPPAARPVIRRLFATRQRNGFRLRWPVEDRYVRLQFDMLWAVLEEQRLARVNYVHFWPFDKQFALVLTHDVESARGREFVRRVADLEEHWGFRSSFNFVPEEYPVNLSFLAELRERGFEVGVHGLKHDGKLFSSHDTFLRQAQRINQYLKSWQAVGFRSPLTHRQPEWMQALDIKYDSSFFDTDPYEPMPGGTMSIWPFMLGHFVELPYTLVQDSTLMQTLGQTTPLLWLEKVGFIRRYNGMALLNSHPDYLQLGQNLSIYEEFLRQVRAMGNYWHALPCEIAQWWRLRSTVSVLREDDHWIVKDLPGSIIKQIRMPRRSTAKTW